MMFVFAISAMTMVSCGDKGPLVVESVVLSATKDGQGLKVIPAATREIFITANLNRMQSGLTGKLVWTAVETSLGKNLHVASVDVNAGLANVISGSASRENDWIKGSYKVDIYLMGNLAKTETFTIE